MSVLSVLLSIPDRFVMPIVGTIGQLDCLYYSRPWILITVFGSNLLSTLQFMLSVVFVSSFFFSDSLAVFVSISNLFRFFVFRPIAIVSDCHVGL